MNRSVSRALPVLFGFFVMGFCDVVGIATSYVKHDFGLNETVAGFIPSMVFVWFLLLAVPAAMAMNRIGRKKMVQASNLITVVGMMIPFVEYNLATCMTAFVLLGIGNTMLQVSLNPLLTNVVKGDALTSSLTAGQVVKAVSSFCGPFIAAFAANRLGDWQYLFPIFAAVTLLSALWLLATPIVEQPAAAEASSVKAAVGLLRDPRIRMLFFGIFFIVGVDVGINTVAPKLLIERAGFAVDAAGYGSSVYFVCRTIGAFVGSILLVKMDDAKYFRLHIAAALAALDYLVDNRIVEDVERKGALFEKLVSQCRGVEEVRRSGLLMAVELGSSEKLYRIMSLFARRGIMSDWFLYCDTAFRISPPLTIADEEIAECCSIIESCLDDL